MAKSSSLNLGSANNAGLFVMPDITSTTIIAGNGANDFVQTGGVGFQTGSVGATATAGNISSDKITFGSGQDDVVYLGIATATANSAQDATATAIDNGSITGDTITVGDGSGGTVIVGPIVTVTATADATHTATGKATVVTGNISNDTIKFGNGDGDSVAIGADVLNFTLTGGNVSGSETSTNAGSITNDTITFGNGVGDSVLVANGLVIILKVDSSSGTTAPFGNLTFDGTNTTHTGDTSNNKISFGDGGSDSVILSVPSLSDNTTFTAGVGSTSISLSALTFSDGKVNDNTITFGNGAGDFVSVWGDLIHNTITFGNGNNDSVTNVFTSPISFAGTSSNNTITMGNGNNDSVTLGVGVTSPGGDTIVTGTGLLDTVQVDTHTNADTFGFALGTNGTAFTTITGARAGDHVISGNNLGTNVVPEGTFGSLFDFYNFVTGLPPTNNTTYMANNGADTFIVTDHKGELGAVELVGVFTGSTSGTHVLTLA
jgi:hypothetical protein